ncbi:MAG: quinolinate synthase NadA [Elusimicrobiota bacterium]|nr:quinolinate synthase NadA [Elusimicrobiota bacterium]
MKKILKDIRRLKKKENAVILVHNYQPPQIHRIADYTGDSLGLSIKAADTEADVIIFCGVDFMAETARILSPNKKVILPAPDATCPMAEMITAPELIKLKKEYPGVPVVTYVNSTAEVKAKSDICCTSANAVKVVKSLNVPKIIFTPDRNLASYVEKITGIEIIKWNGFCPVHERITRRIVMAIQERYPDAVFMAHPECLPEVIEMADYTVSTGGMSDVVAQSSKKNFIVGTEMGMIYPLSKEFPGKEFISAGSRAVCKNMKKITLKKVFSALENLEPEIKLDPEVSARARLAVQKMLEVS